MLADMYLWKQDYQNAVKYADKVIDAKLDEYKETQQRQSSQLSTLNSQLFTTFAAAYKYF
jgi:AMMECR1 domain-containing protein